MLTVKTLVKITGNILLRTFDRLTDKVTGKKITNGLSAQDLDNILLPHKDILLQEYVSASRRIKINNVKDFYKVETDIGQDNNWKGLPLLLFNYPFENNMQLCPETTRVIRQIPGCTSAMFSVLGPGKHITPHKGIYKGIYRCLFGLQVPAAGKCWIRINEDIVQFENGRSIVFDETDEHEVKNESGEYRIALYLDIYRNLPFPMNLFNKLLFELIRRSYFITNILKEYERLEQENAIMSPNPVSP